MEEEARIYLFEELKIKQQHVFDFDELYKTLFRWFEVNEYDFHEREYEKTEKANETDLIISWFAEKGMESGYLKYIIEMDFKVDKMQDVEIEKEGLKMAMNKASIEIKMTAYLLKDVGNVMAKKLGKVGRSFYERTMRNKLDEHESVLFNETHMLIDEIKSFLAMHNVK